jgi:hypothetical protein
MFVRLEGDNEGGPEVALSRGEGSAGASPGPASPSGPSDSDAASLVFVLASAGERPADEDPPDPPGFESRRLDRVGSSVPSRGWP